MGASEWTGNHKNTHLQHLCVKDTGSASFRVKRLVCTASDLLSCGICDRDTFLGVQYPFIPTELRM